MHDERTLESVLLIDDELDILTIAEYALTKVGRFKVKACIDSELAVEEAEEFMPDVILLDMMMPKMDGIQTLIKFKNIESLDHVPIIFMTAKTEKKEIDRYLNIGAIGVIQKPFDPMTLSLQVIKLWEDQYNGVVSE